MTIRVIKRIAVAALLFAAAPVGAQSPGELVDAVYRTYFGREADPGGVKIWTREIRNGADPLELEAGFLASVEYYQRAGNTPDGFIVALHRDLAGGQPTRQELNRWLRFLELRGGDMTARSQVAMHMMRETGGGVVQTHMGRRGPRDDRRDLPLRPGRDRYPESYRETYREQPYRSSWWYRDR